MAGNSQPNCSVSDIELKLTALFVLSSTGGAAALVCLLAAVLVIVARLHKLFAYRLALYHVFIGLVSGTVCACELLSVLYYDDPVSVHNPCTAIAFLMQYSLWMKLCFTGWVTIHLFCSAICNRDLKKLEILCIFASLLIPAVMSIVPVASPSSSYGLAGAWCWIKSMNECSSNAQSEGVAAQLTLWHGPAAGMLVLVTVTLLTVVVTLACRMYAEKVDRDRAVLVIRRPTYTSDLNQLLPLLAYPVTWCLMVIPSLLEGVYRAYSIPRWGFVLANAFCTPAWSLAAGVTMVIHVLLVLGNRASKTLGERRARYGSIEDFGSSAAYYSTESVNWSSSFRSSTSCELANRNTGTYYPGHQN